MVHAGTSRAPGHCCAVETSVPQSCASAGPIATTMTPVTHNIIVLQKLLDRYIYLFVE